MCGTITDKKTKQFLLEITGSSHMPVEYKHWQICNLKIRFHVTSLGSQQMKR